MTKITWDNIGERFYETGVEHGVLYPYKNDAYQKGVAWNGLTAVSESPEGAEATPLYADNIKYLNLISNEEFKATVEAYTYPDEFAECDGSAALAAGVYAGQQKRTMFGLSYVTKVGNDTDGTDKGKKYHLIYGATAAPSEKSYATINDSPEAITFSWEISTVPIEVGSGFRPTACITIDTTKVNDDSKIAALEDILYGNASNDAAMPTIAQLQSIFGTSFTLTITEDEDTEVTVTRSGVALSNGATIAAGDVLTISVTGGTITVNGTAFTSGNTYTVAGNTTVVSTKSE